MSNETFGDVLREFMERNEWNAAEMAKACGLSPRFIERMLTGERHPARNTITKLQKALKLNTHEHARFMYAAGFSGKDTVLFNDPILQEINALMPHLTREARPLVMSALRLAYSRAFNGRRLP